MFLVYLKALADTVTADTCLPTLLQVLVSVLSFSFILRVCKTYTNNTAVV